MLQACCRHILCKQCSDKNNAAYIGSQGENKYFLLYVAPFFIPSMKAEALTGRSISSALRPQHEMQLLGNYSLQKFQWIGARIEVME
jgi:hypothetical protein